jgi:hypothetical protein
MVSDRLEILISPYQRHVYWWQTYAFLFAFVRIYVLNYSTIYALTFSIYSITHAENNNKLLTCKHVYMLFVCVRFIFNSTVFFQSIFIFLCPDGHILLVFFFISAPTMSRDWSEYFLQIYNFVVENKKSLIKYALHSPIFFISSFADTRKSLVLSRCNTGMLFENS